MNYDSMNKGQLRQEMRNAGLSYKGLDNAGMKAALVAHNAPAEVAAPVVQEEEVVAVDPQVPAHLIEASELAPAVQEELAQIEQEAEVDAEALLDVALLAVVDAAAAHIAVGELDAPAVQVPEAAPTVQIPSPLLAPRGTSKGLKIEKDRPMQNGVKMPSAGGMCRAVWDYCAAELEGGSMPTAKSVKAHAGVVGWNLNNASIEFYNWRKFNGISGRHA